MRIFVENSARMTKENESILGGATETVPARSYRAGELTQYAYETLPTIIIDEAIEYIKAHQDDYPDNPVARARAEKAFEQLFLKKLLYVLMSDYNGTFKDVELVMSIYERDPQFIERCYLEALRVNPGLDIEKAAELNLISPARQKEADQEENPEAENNSFLPNSATAQPATPRPEQTRRSRRRRR